MSSWLRELPHQIPFRAATATTLVGTDTLEGKFLCTANDALQPGAFPLDIMLLEAMAQFAGGLAFQEQHGHGFLTGIDRCEVTRLVQPGDLVHISVTLEASFGGMFRFRGSGSIDGVECIRGRFYLSTPPAGD